MFPWIIEVSLSFMQRDHLKGSQLEIETAARWTLVIVAMERQAAQLQYQS